MKYQHNKGVIKDSAVKALVTSALCRSRVEQNDKGKGSYKRFEKHRKDLRLAA